jgi:hypothetical protein
MSGYPEAEGGKKVKIFCFVLAFVVCVIYGQQDEYAQRWGHEIDSAPIAPEENCIVRIQYAPHGIKYVDRIDTVAMLPAAGGGILVKDGIANRYVYADGWDVKLIGQISTKEDQK